MTKYRSKLKARRNLHTELRYNTVDMIATEKTRTAKPAVYATCFLCGVHNGTNPILSRHSSRLGAAQISSRSSIAVPMSIS